MFPSLRTTNPLASGSWVTMGSAMMHQASAKRVKTDASRIDPRGRIEDGMGEETIRATIGI